jgi:proteic killer suppression protein
MIRSFADKGTEDVFDGDNTSDARRVCPRELWSVAFRKLDQLDSATDIRDLRTPPGNRLERLKGDREGQHSIGINERFRICFWWMDTGPEQVEIVDYHG